jgi:cell division protein FtsL
VELYLQSPITPPWRGALLKHRDSFTLPFIIIIIIIIIITFIIICMVVARTEILEMHTKIVGKNEKVRDYWAYMGRSGHDSKVAHDRILW